MTAIGIVRTIGGFIVGADGRMRLHEQDRNTADAATLKKETDKAKKISAIVNSGRTLAYAIRGFVKDTHGFNFWETMEEQIRSLAILDFDDCFKYVEDLGEKMNRAMNEAKQAGAIDQFPEDRRIKDGAAWEVTDVFFPGYFKTDPCLVVIKFLHYDQISEFRLLQPPPWLPILCGSEIVKAAMYDSNGNPLPGSLFAEHTRCLSHHPTLREGEEYIKGYIEACSSPLALEMDAKTCQNIGGHIHIAEVTPAGFRWRIPPLA
jgi:hypothetical protein